MPMNEVKILTVADKSDLNIFIRLPWTIYKNYPNWVPPLLMERKQILNKKKNPFFTHAEMELFLAFKGNKPVGRIAAIKNDLHNKHHNDNAGFFGFFECINDKEVARLLLDKAVEWLKGKGLTCALGPANPSSNDDWGLLIEGFDLPPAFMMPYNPDYYINLIEGYGFTKAKDLYAYKIVDEKVIKVEKIKRLVDTIKERNKIIIEYFNPKDFPGELEKVKHVYNNAWAPNWGFIPMTEEEIDHLATDLKPLLEPSLCLFVTRENETIAFTLTLPDYNQIFKKMNGKLFPFGFLKLITQKRKIDLARILTLGIIPEYQKKGIDAVLYWELLNNAAKLGIGMGEASWILEDNEMMNKAMLNIGGDLYKKYRIYQLNF